MAKKGSTGRHGRPRYYEGEIDRYYYVDRDIYSSSAKQRAASTRKPSSSRKRKKKKNSGRKILTAIFCLLLFTVVGVVVGSKMFLSQIERHDVDTTGYVQQPADAPALSACSSAQSWRPDSPTSSPGGISPPSAPRLPAGVPVLPGSAAWPGTIRRSW